MNTLVEDWRRFIRHGFRSEDFSDALFKHLAEHAGFEAFSAPDAYLSHPADKDRFWHYYFDEGLSWLMAFVEQFGGHLDSLEGFDDDWIELSSLNQVLIDEMQLIYPALTDVLWARENEIYAAYKDYNLDNVQAEVGAFDSVDLAEASTQYDQDFYYYGGQEIFDYEGVDDDLRDRLAQAVAKTIQTGSTETLFEARLKQTPPTVVSSAQETLFATHVRKRSRPYLHRLTDVAPRERVMPTATVSPAEVAHYQSMRAML